VKKLLVYLICITILSTFAETAHGIYTPGLDSNLNYTEADLNIAEKAIAGIKWDTSKAETENKIILTLPKHDGYRWMVRKDTGEYVGIGLYWDQFYSGNGDVSIELDQTNLKGTGIYIFFSNVTTFRVLADETFVYFPGIGIKHIPPEDRIYASIDDQGNIIQYYDVEYNELSTDDPKVTDRFQHSYAVFSDFNASHWAYNVIYELTTAGYIKGYPDGTFKPENNITRAEFSAIMSHLLIDKYPDGPNNNNDGIFPDFTESHWGYSVTNDMLSYLTRVDAVSIFDQKFKPDQKITREDVVAVIHAALKDSGKLVEGNENVSFTDLQLSDFPNSIEYCVKQGFIKGYPDGSFRPENNITRAEIAAILVKVMNSL